MNTRASIALAVAAVAASLFMSRILPPADAQSKPVDKTGLDILCSGKGDVYSAPSKSGVSSCLFADGQVMVCDSKTDKCYSAPEGGKEKATVVEGAMTLRLLKQLNDKTDRLTREIEAIRRQPQTPK